MDAKCLLELTVVEDFLAVVREMSNRKQGKQPST